MNNKHEYSINIEFSKVDNCFIARVPVLGPYISAFGDTYEDALREVKTVIELTLKTYKDNGLTPPKPKQVKKVI